ncbi:MAG: 2OG-Fe(II) oxygenase, partial [Verrucomicrobiota bacterium]
MSDESIEVTYAEGFGGLVEALEKVEKPGDFQVSGKHETPMPILSVEGVGQISFPVPTSQARDLIATAAERAPYGRGDQTLVDESVRKVWQVPPEKISLEGKGWASKFDELVARVAEGLGLAPKEVRAEFYKLLVYDEGGFFAAHRDTEKAGGMFGTLVVALPSAHEGGELLVRHAGREAVVDLRGTDPGEVGFAAFFADCEHEVRPVVSGYRVCLIFNLVLATRRRDSDPQPPDERPFVEKSAKALQAWTSRSDCKPEKIAWLLDHKYTASGLSFSALKGRDAAVAKVLLEAAKISGCAFHLGIVHIEESGWAEYTGYHGRRRGRWYSNDDEEEEDSEEYEVGEVCDSAAFIDEWRDSSDRPVEFGKIPLGENEVLPPEALEGEEPDEIHFSEATGNAGADFERCYLRAAIVLWPESAYDKICLSAGEKAGIARLEGLVREGAKDSVERLTAHLIDRWKDDPENLDRLLQVLNEHREPALLESAVSKLLPSSYDGSQNETL